MSDNNKVRSVPKRTGDYYTSTCKHRDIPQEHSMTATDDDSHDSITVPPETSLYTQDDVEIESHVTTSHENGTGEWIGSHTTNLSAPGAFAILRNGRETYDGTADNEEALTEDASIESEAPPILSITLVAELVDTEAERQQQEELVRRVSRALRRANSDPSDEEVMREIARINQEEEEEQSIEIAAVISKDHSERFKIFGIVMTACFLLSMVVFGVLAALLRPWVQDESLLADMQCNISFVLLNVESGEPIGELKDLIDLCIHDMPLSVEALAPCADSVSFYLFDSLGIPLIPDKLERSRPFTLGGDIESTGEFVEVQELSTPGNYTLTATALQLSTDEIWFLETSFTVDYLR